MLKMTQEEAQKVLDERNGNFQIISYNGMRNNSTVLRGLYDFIKINSIPAMKRKWNRLEVLNI